MNNAETSFWKLVRRNLAGFATRIENVVSSGIPDVVVVRAKKAFFIELKVEKDGWVYFRSSQIAFFAKCKKEQHYVRVMVRSENDILIVKSTSVLALEGKPYKTGYLKYRYQDLNRNSWLCSKPWDWSFINDVLFPDG